MTNNPAPQPEQDDYDERDRLDEHLEHMSEEQFRRQMRQAAYLLTMGKGKEALPLLERCYQIRPDDVNVLTNLGGAYILAELHSRAVPLLEQASQLDDQNPAIWSNLAAAYLGKLVISNRERQDRALEAYQRVIDLDANYPNVHYNMGLIYVDRRDWDEAYASFTRALESNPKDKDALNMRSRVEEIQSRPNDPGDN